MTRIIDQNEFRAMSDDDKWRHFRDAQDRLSKGIVMPCDDLERARLAEMAALHVEDGDVGEYLRSWAITGLEGDEEDAR